MVLVFHTYNPHVKLPLDVKTLNHHWNNHTSKVALKRGKISPLNMSYLTPHYRFPHHHGLLLPSELATPCGTDGPKKVQLIQEQPDTFFR